MERGKSQEDIIRDLFDDYDISQELTTQYLEEPNSAYIPETVYRQAEYDYFLNKQQPENKVIKFEQIQVKDQLNGFDKLVKINRLKKITVQTSFTRNEPIDIDSILISEDGYKYEVKRQSVSKIDMKHDCYLPLKTMAKAFCLFGRTKIKTVGKQ